MTGIELYVVFAFFVFSYLCIIWSSNGAINVFLKFLFFVMTTLGLYFCIQTQIADTAKYLHTETNNLKAERIKLEQVRQLSTNSIPYEK